MRSALAFVLAACACAAPTRDAQVVTPPERAAAAPAAVRAAPVPSTPPLPSEPIAPPPAALEALGDAPEIDAAVEQAIAAQKLPGAVVVIGHRDGVVFAHAYGQRAIVPAPEAMTLDTLFDLASLTKPIVTATLAMKLVEQGRLQLDASAATYLPELSRHGHGAITVRQLLLHSAGLPTEDPLRDYDAGPAAGLQALFASPQLTAAGTTFRYSDVGYIVLGALIERVAGASLDTLAKHEIFEPLAMRDAGFRPGADVIARVAPTEVPDDVRKRIDPEAVHEPAIRGKVHDPRAFRLGGVAGNAGMFASAADLARFARMLLSQGALEGARVLEARSVEAMTTPTFIGATDTVRALGWDMRSEYSGLRGTRLSYRAFGHGGFTGTSLWIDPAQDLFVIVLSNRVHPNGTGHMIKLAAELADRAVQRFARTPRPASCAALAGHVQTGIDVLRADGFSALAGKRFGLLANAASRARDGTLTRDLLRDAPQGKLRALFSAEHGWDRSREGRLDGGTDAVSALPVHSLFGTTRKPTAAMLKDLDALVFDLQDAGVRFYTYVSSLRFLLEAAAERGIEVIVLDRPNPLGADLVEGPVLDTGRETFVNYHTLPLRHGMTAGELARMLNEERHIGAKLQVIEMRGYARELPFSQTGLSWEAPSPNLPTLDAIELYPALGLIEGANISVGRGTDRPFGFVGAPWLDAQALTRRLHDAGLTGIELEVAERTPTRDRFASKLCHGVLVRVRDHDAFDATRLGFTLASALIAQHASALNAPELGKLLGHRRTLDALLRGASPAELERAWEPDLMRFSQRRARFLTYPSCDAAVR